MQKTSLELKQEIIRKLLKGKITKIEAARIIECRVQTIYNYLNKVAKAGLGALKDGRRSNNFKLTPKQYSLILKEKRDFKWRSARKVLEITNIPSVTQRWVQKVWVKEGLNRVNLERLKPITRFVAKNPNDLW